MLHAKPLHLKKLRKSSAVKSAYLLHACAAQKVFYEIDPKNIKEVHMKEVTQMPT